MLPSSLTDGFAQLGLMGWPLVACSVLAIAVCLERVMFLRNVGKHSDEVRSNLLAEAKEHADQPKALRDELLSLRVQQAQGPYFAGLKLLRIVGTISPMIGLLGTILGIITAFQVISVQTGPVTPNIIADGLWEAMLTTAVGLCIALPALICAHFFRHKSDVALGKIVNDLNEYSLSLELEKGGEASAKKSEAATKIDRLAA